MSRTERCRHLPKTGKKIVDGAGGGWRQHRNEAEKEALKRMGLSKKPAWRILVKTKGATHQEWVEPVYGTPWPMLSGFIWRTIKVPGHYVTKPGIWRPNAEYIKFEKMVESIQEERAKVTAYHPYQKHPPMKGAKKRMRIQDNRSARHKTKAKLRKFDPDSTLLPSHGKPDWWRIN